MMESMPGKKVHFVNSPFSRAKETGAIVAAAVGIKEDSPNFEINNDLRERFFGKDLELKKSSEHYPTLWKEDEASNGTKGPGPDGESANAVAERIQGVVKGLEEKHKDAIIILSAHGDICTIGLAALTGSPISTHFKNGLANCELRPAN
ncbi:histidine phosphatase superfamily [Dunaliella salina]|nr:histidine phosphatase superfamily [Dunaliella salina]|eukprot:KAF5828681.1 histidine phosphatase superfamily [Dunaliella salina]